MLPAMVLCAGFGTRLRPLTHHLPKPMLPIGDRPALLHIVDQLRPLHFAPLVINTHHRADAFLGAIPPDVSVLHEPEILGTAGGVVNAASCLGAGDVLVWNGDMQVAPDLERLVTHHMSAVANGAAATILAAPNERGRGTLGVDDSGNVARLRGESFGEESAGADYLGIIILSQPARSILPERGCLVGDLLMPLLRKGGRVAVALHEGDWLDIGSPSQYLEANLRWLRTRGVNSFVAADARVAPGVRLSRAVVLRHGVVSGEGDVYECVVLDGAQLQAPAHRSIALPGTSIHVPS